MTTSGPITSTSWWREVAEASWRQALQIVLPFVVLVGSTGRLDAQAAAATGVLAGVGVAVVVLRRVAGVTAPDGAAPAVTMAYRAVSAAAAVVLGVLSAEQLDLMSVDWAQVATTAAAAAVTAVLHGILDAPASTITSEQ